MTKQVILLITSFFIIIGFALFLLGTMTYLDPGWYYSEVVENRNRAYVEFTVGFIFTAAGVAIFLIYGDSEVAGRLLKRISE